MQTKDISDYRVCVACRDAYLTMSSADLLIERTGAPEKVALRAMERACNRGLIEYGMTISRAWLTSEGKKLLTVNEKGAE